MRREKKVDSNAAKNTLPLWRRSSICFYDRCARLCKLGKPDVTEGFCMLYTITMVHNGAFGLLFYIYFVKCSRQVLGVVDGVLSLPFLRSFPTHPLLSFSVGIAFLFTQGKPLLLRRRNGSMLPVFTLLISAPLRRCADCGFLLACWHGQRIIPNH